MIIQAIKKQKRGKAKIDQSRCRDDVTLQAVLYYLWRGGELKAYPLNPEVWPDNEETEAAMAVAILKLKLRCDCQKVPCFRDKLITKRCKI